jgi:radical SAM superfamily enzyme YgiQ (UPF0313 family)
MIGHSPPRRLVENLDEMPFPAWDLVDPREYWRQSSMCDLRCGSYMNLFTSRGCPFGCSYCSTSAAFGKRFRARSPESVLAETRILMERYNISHLEIVDDIFNWDLRRAKRILDGWKRAGFPVEVCFPNSLRFDRLDREFLENLAGFKGAYAAAPVDTASPRIQTLIGKNLDLARTAEMIDICASLGIYTRGFFMLGFPTETKAEIQATIDFAVKSRLHAAVFFGVIPLKGTALYESCLPQLAGRALQPSDFNYFSSRLNLSAVPDAEFLRLRLGAPVRFFASPSRLCRILRDYPDRRLLWRAALRWRDFFFRRRPAAKEGTASVG